ncbi:hypothetical protein ACN268_05735 [Micromonospora sp. WMMD735]|uniref:hypothetical protein n=1 Tax=Micromonospora sp. WMMD735 TaxID=3404130 RepID=UPI003B9364EF
MAAAERAGVTDVVYTSFHPIAGLFDAHRATEEALAAAGPVHTVLRNPFYTASRSSTRRSGTPHPGRRWCTRPGAGT